MAAVTNPKMPTKMTRMFKLGGEPIKYYNMQPVHCRAAPQLSLRHMCIWVKGGRTTAGLASGLPRKRTLVGGPSTSAKCQQSVTALIQPWFLKPLSQTARHFYAVRRPGQGGPGLGRLLSVRSRDPPRHWPVTAVVDGANPIVSLRVRR